jgi:hypothetical protein
LCGIISIFAVDLDAGRTTIYSRKQKDLLEGVKYGGMGANS